MTRELVPILLTSVGRRTYLIDWFRSASKLLNIDARIIAADANPSAPAMDAGDAAVVLPTIDSNEYIGSVESVCRERGIRLLVSVNDYDIAKLSRSLGSLLVSDGAVVAVPPPTTIRVAEDKYAMTLALSKARIPVPQTTLGSRVSSGGFEGQSSWVIKHRFGSGSSGLFVVDSSVAPNAVALSAALAPTRSGRRSLETDLDLVVVQERVEGTEYGIDVVCTFDGQFQGVLARRKLRMRSGETDQAVAVDPAPFMEVGQRLAAELELCGTTDVDIIVTPDGTPVVIDINPRFGGGYPFMHMAGANVPACYLAWVIGRQVDPSWLEYESEVVSSKYEAIQRSGAKWT